MDGDFILVGTGVVLGIFLTLVSFAVVGEESTHEQRRQCLVYADECEFVPSHYKAKE